MSLFELRNMVPGDRDEIARLIYHSTNRYYVSIGHPPLFTGDELSAGVFFDVYERMDPGRGLVAVDRRSGRIIGSCFVHPRETHVSLGIRNVHPERFRQGVAKGLLQAIIGVARSAGRPLRLVSSCLNLDSYSLYTRAGLVPYCTYQDLYLSIPAGGLPFAPPAGVAVREAVMEDVEAMASIEQEVSGITRVGDYRYFLRNAEGFWHVSVVEGANGLDGFLVSCGAQALNMLGPGVARTQEQAAALIHAELNRHPGRSPLMVVPVACGDLVRQLYAWGARNCELHVGQALGHVQAPRGVTMPSYLPESG